MNLRISPQMLRFRISPAELVDLQQGKALTAQLDLPSHALRYDIQRATHLPPDNSSNGLLAVQSRIDNNQLVLQLNATPAALIELDRDPPAKEGIHDYQSNADGELLTIALEVDLGKKSPSNERSSAPAQSKAYD